MPGATMSVGPQSPFDPYHVWLGIPPQEQPPNCYRLLGIPAFEDNAEVISSAADRQMAHLRTFQSGKYSEQSQKLLNEVAGAKVRLLKPAAKKAYDAELRQKLAPKPSPARVQRPPAAPVTPARVVQASPEVDDFENAIVASARRPSRAARKRKPAYSQGLIAVLMMGGSGLLLAGVIAWKLHTRPDETPPQVATSNDISRSELAKAARANAERPVVAPPIEKIVELTAPPKEVKEPSAPAAVEAPKETAPRRQVQAPVFVAPEKEVKEPSEPPSVQPFEPPPSVSDDQPESPPPSLPQAERKPVPSPDAQEAVRKQLATIYDPEQAKTPREKLKLAAELVEVAGKPDTSETERFVLLQEAVEIAGDGGDAALMLQTVDALDRQFELDAVEQRKKAILRFAERATTSERIRSLVSVGTRTIAQAVQQEHFESALELANAVARASQRPQGKEFRKEAVQRRDAVRALVQQRTELDAAKEVLRTNPSDGAANRVLGRWYCIYREDWPQGLPYLAKGDDDGLKLLAERELNSSSGSADDQMQLADAWWELGSGRKGEERDAILLHAGHWYEQFLKSPQSGLTKLRVEKRLEELVDARQRFRAFQAKRMLQSPDAGADSLWGGAAP